MRKSSIILIILIILILGLGLAIWSKRLDRPTAYYIEARGDGLCRVSIVVVDDLDNDICLVDYIDSCNINFSMDKLESQLETQPGFPTPLAASWAYYRLVGY